ncbi:MAG: DUF1905 domain-containing protein [Anaerolineales bacterium]
MLIEFSGKIWYWRGPAPFYFVTVPPEQSEVLHAISEEVTYGWGMIPVFGQINATRWKTSLFPKDGGYIVPLKDMVRSAEGLEEGQEVTIQLTIRD